MPNDLRRRVPVAGVYGVLLTLAVAGCAAVAPSGDSSMSFFLTSQGPGDGGNLGGLAGADAHCRSLAEAAGARGKTWRAYLSTTGSGAVNARDRIGTGPWANANGVIVADNVADLHSSNNRLSKENSTSESGAVINGRGDSPNRHDILTGSSAMGYAVNEAGHNACGNWMSNSSDGSARVGHHDRTGGGQDPTSWNSAHGSRGCSQSDLQGTGGDGLYYCFAVN